MRLFCLLGFLSVEFDVRFGIVCLRTESLKEFHSENLVGGSRASFDSAERYPGKCSILLRIEKMQSF